ncbi:hypothetical protein [Cellulomonas sp. P5_C5]
MITHRTSAVALTVALAAGLALSGCGPAANAPEPPVAAAVKAPEPAPTTPEPTVAPITVVVGTVVPATDIEAVRAAGGNVYVSPRGDGTGLVVDPAATIPQVVYDDMFVTSVASVTAEQLAAEQTSAEPDMDGPVSDAVVAANFRLFVVYPFIRVHVPGHAKAYRDGYGGGFLTPESKALNDALYNQIPTRDWDQRSPDTVLATVKPFLDAHPAQVVILK